MKPVKYSARLTIVLDPTSRKAVELCAEREQTSLGDVVRRLLNAGIEAEGL